MTENLASTAHDIWNNWTAVSTLLGLISSVYHDLPHNNSVVEFSSEFCGLCFEMFYSFFYMFSRVEVKSLFSSIFECIHMMRHKFWSGENCEVTK